MSLVKMKKQLKAGLHAAAQAGNLPAVLGLIAAGADVNKTLNKYKETALMLAAKNGRIAVVQALLEAGAAVNVAHKYGRTALHVAAGGGHAAVIEVLLAAGANPDIVDMYRDTALHEAVSGSHVAIVEALLAAGANMDIVGWHELTPVQSAAWHGHVAVFNALMAAGAALDVSKVDSSGYTLLYHAAEAGHTAVVQALLAVGADINAINGLTRESALSTAALHCHAETVQVLLAAGADVHGDGNPADSALCGAAQNHSDDVETVQLVLAADTYTSEEHQAALVTASEYGNTSVVELLLPYCHVEQLAEALLFAAQPNYIYSGNPDAAVLLLHELAAAGQAAAAVASVLQRLPGWRGAEEAEALLSLAMLNAWADDTAVVDAQLAAVTARQQHAAAVACSVPDAVVALAAPPAPLDSSRPQQ